MLITIAIAGIIGFVGRKILRKRKFRRHVHNNSFIKGTQRKYQMESKKLRKMDEAIGRRERMLH